MDSVIMEKGVGQLLTEQMLRAIEANASADRLTKRVLRKCAERLPSLVESFCPVVITTDLTVAYGPDVFDDGGPYLMCIVTLNCGVAMQFNGWPQADWGLMPSRFSNSECWGAVVRCLERDQNPSAAIVGVSYRLSDQEKTVLDAQAAHVRSLRGTPVYVVLAAEKGGKVCGTIGVCALPPGIQWQLDGKSAS